MKMRELIERLEKLDKHTEKVFRKVAVSLAKEAANKDKQKLSGKVSYRHGREDIKVYRAEGKDGYFVQVTLLPDFQGSEISVMSAVQDSPNDLSYDTNWVKRISGVIPGDLNMVKLTKMRHVKEQGL